MAQAQPIVPDPDAFPRVKAAGLSKRFGQVEALSCLSVDLNAGEIVGVIGRNGAGKTTLLNLLAGVTAPSSGSLNVMGLDRWVNNYEIRTRTTFLPANLSSFLAQYPYGHLRLLAQLYDMDEGVFASRVWDLVHQMDLGSHWQKSWTSLSLGMIKKAGLVGVFLPDADLRILDEPFAGGVDPLGMEALYRWMIQSRARGETIVFSTQVLEQAGAICDRILLLEKGSLRWLGAPDDLVKEAGLDPDEPRAFARAFASICSGNPEVRAGTEVWR